MSSDKICMTLKANQISENGYRHENQLWKLGNCLGRTTQNELDVKVRQKAFVRSHHLPWWTQSPQSSSEVIQLTK